MCLCIPSRNIWGALLQKYVLKPSVHVCSVMSNSLGHRGLQPARLLCPRGSPGKNTVLGCHALPQGIFPMQDWTCGSCLAGEFFTAEPLGRPPKPYTRDLLQVITIYTVTGWLFKSRIWKPNFIVATVMSKSRNRKREILAYFLLPTPALTPTRALQSWRVSQAL